MTYDFATVLGIRVLEGRFLQPADEQADHRVCVIDRAMANLYWPDESPLGHRLNFDTEFDEKTPRLSSA